MTLENIKQNAETLSEVVNNYESVLKQKERIFSEIEDAKARKDKTTLKSLQKSLESVNAKLSTLRSYANNLMAAMQKLVDEEKNAI